MQEKREKRARRAHDVMNKQRPSELLKHLSLPFQVRIYFNSFTQRSHYLSQLAEIIFISDRAPIAA